MEITDIFRTQEQSHGQTLLLNSVSKNNALKIIDYFKISIGEIANNEIFGEYVFDNNNRKVFNNLLYYFLGFEYEYDLNKGIALVGGYGTGKTTIFKIFHSFLKRHFNPCGNLFIISSIEEIITERSERDFMYAKFLYNLKENERGGKYNDPKHVLVNEFGHKYNVKIYGTDVNEICDMFLMKRYDIFQSTGKLTHITANYDAQDFENMFHPRIVDRFKEMFNIVYLGGDSRRN